MEDKSYTQMRQEFTEFYHKEIKPRLPEYLEMRRVEGPLQVFFWIFFLSFLLFFAILACSELSISSPNFLQNLSIIPTFNRIKGVLFGIYVIIFISSLIGLLIFSKLSKNPNNTDNTVYIQQDLEMNLKNELMPKFVNIFFENAIWHKQSLFGYEKTAKLYENVTDINGVKTVLETEKARRKNEKEKFEIKNIRALKLLNPFPWIRYDDIIFGYYKDTSIKIYEANTKILYFREFVLVLFLVIVFGLIFSGLSSLKLLLLILVGVSVPPLIPALISLMPIIFILAIFACYKIYQYSYFRGVIVEFDMNKPFKGHTIFHENSFTARKIPFNKTILEKVNLESTTFENKYNVFSDNQIEARYILTPALMERIENLKFKFKAKYVRGSFKNNKLTLAIHTGKDMFAMGSDFKDSDVHTFEELYDEMISICKIVDQLKLNEHTGL